MYVVHNPDMSYEIVLRLPSGFNIPTEISSHLLRSLITYLTFDGSQSQLNFFVNYRQNLESLLKTLSIKV